MEKVIIIGAGVAGISAAMRLCDAGRKVEIFEQKSQVGGRITAIYDNPTGDTIDNGQHLLTGAYSRFLEILEKLGTSDSIISQNALKIPFYSKDGQSLLDTSLLPGSFGMLAGLLKMDKIKFSSKIKAIKLLTMIKLGLNDYESDCKTFLLKHKQSKDMLDHFWEPLVLATINAHLNTAPAKLLINVLKKAFLADRKSAVLMFPAVDLASLVEPVGRYIKNAGGTLNTSQKVSRLIFNEERCTGIELSNRNIVRADNIIVTVPDYAFKKLLPDEIAVKFSNFSYSPILSIYYWFDKDYFDFEFAGVVGYKTQWIFNRRRILKHKSANYPGHITVTISAADELITLPQDEISKMIFDELAEIFSLEQSVKPLRHRVIIEKFATPLFSPESEKKRPAEKTVIQGLYIAGDRCETELPATIEGAAISGMNAADEIIKSFG